MNIMNRSKIFFVAFLAISGINRELCSANKLEKKQIEVDNLKNKENFMYRTKVFFTALTIGAIYTIVAPSSGCSLLDENSKINLMKNVQKDIVDKGNFLELKDLSLEQCDMREISNNEPIYCFRFKAAPVLKFEAVEKTKYVGSSKKVKTLTSGIEICSNKKELESIGVILPKKN